MPPGIRALIPATITHTGMQSDSMSSLSHQAAGSDADACFRLDLAGRGLGVSGGSGGCRRFGMSVCQRDVNGADETLKFTTPVAQFPRVRAPGPAFAEAPARRSLARPRSASRRESAINPWRL